MSVIISLSSNHEQSIKDIVSFKWKGEPNVLTPPCDWEYAGNIIIKQHLLGFSSALRTLSSGCQHLLRPAWDTPSLVDAKLSPEGFYVLSSVIKEIRSHYLNMESVPQTEESCGINFLKIIGYFYVL